MKIALLIQKRNTIQILLYYFISTLASKAAVRIHLFTLLFEECKVLAAKIVDESNIVMAMTHLLSNAPKVLGGIDTEKKENQQITPKWMTPLLLFIDLHEKVILGTDINS